MLAPGREVVGVVGVVAPDAGIVIVVGVRGPRTRLGVDDPPFMTCENIVESIDEERLLLGRRKNLGNDGERTFRGGAYGVGVFCVAKGVGVT